MVPSRIQVPVLAISRSLSLRAPNTNGNEKIKVEDRHRRARKKALRDEVFVIPGTAPIPGKKEKKSHLAL